jgi:hypothetical protein
VHVDIKKHGRIPDGGGHSMFARTIGKDNNHRPARCHSFLRHAVDDHSRLTHSEFLVERKRETAAGIWLRAKVSFATAVMPDNKSRYRSCNFASALGDIKHR